MNDAGLGLTALSTDHLQKLLRMVHRGELECPFSRSILMSMGFNRVAEEGTALIGLNEKAVRAVLVSVLAERQKRS